MKDTILDRMKKSGYVDPERFELRSKNPEDFRGAVGPLVSVGYEIEGDTTSTAEVVRLLAPGPHVDIWEGQELWHAITYAEMAIKNDIEIPDLTHQTPDTFMERLGKWVEHSALAADLLGMVVALEGYKNEGQNMSAQHRARMRLRGIGEHSIAGAFSAMYAQEALHAAYYLADLNERRNKHPMLYRLAQYLALRDPRPIGANTPERMERIGAVMVNMFEQGEVEQSLARVVRPLGFSRKQQERLADGVRDCVLAYTVA